MTEIEKFFSERADADYRDLLGRYAYGWASSPVQKVARSIVGLDLLAAVGVAQKLQRSKKATVK